MKLPGLESRVSFGLPGFAGLPTLRSGRHSSPGLKAWGFLAGFIKSIFNDAWLEKKILYYKCPTPKFLPLFPAEFLEVLGNPKIHF
jgi:hypothetical protein